jgi:hypothetical protein
MTGECSAKFHTHAKVEITPISHIGYVPVAGYISSFFFFLVKCILLNFLDHKKMICRVNFVNNWSLT